MQNVNTLCIAAQSPQDTHSTYGIVQRTESDRMANAIRLDGGRNPIGWRTQSNRTANAILWQRGHFQGALLGGALVSSAPTKLHQQSKQRECPTEYAEHTEPSGREAPPTDCTDAHRLGGYGIPAIPTPPITQPNIPWIPWENTTTLVQLPLQHQQSKQRECPTEYAEHTEPSGREVPPTDRHGCAQISRVWHPAIPTLPITQPNIP